MERLVGLVTTLAGNRQLPIVTAEICADALLAALLTDIES